MKTFFSNLTKETRKIKWSSLSDTTKAFIYTVITVAIITLIVVLFSWGITSFINAFK